MSETRYFNLPMETMPGDKRQAWDDSRVRQTVTYAYENAPGFRRIMDEAHVLPTDVQNVADLVKIPITRKDMMIDLQRNDPPFGGFLMRPLHELRRMYLSPGPLFDLEGPEVDYWRLAPGLYAGGFRLGDVVLNTAAYHMTPLGFMIDGALREIGCMVIPTGTGNTEAQIEIIRTMGVTAFAGQPSFLMTILERGESMGIDWKRDTRLTKAFVTAEPFPNSLRQAFAERGITARQGYGTAELGNLGFECDVVEGWHLPYDALVQVCDITTGNPLGHGEEGEVVVTLFNKTHALIRFGTGDLSALNTDRCTCGRTTLRLVGWLGRVGQAVKVRGMFVHPRQVAQAISQFPEVTRYQALVTRQGARDELTVQIEWHADVGCDPEAISLALQNAIKLKALVQVVEQGTISSGAAPLQDLRTWD